MKTFRFSTIEEFRNSVQEDALALSVAIFESIKENYDKRKKTAKLFNLYIVEDGLEYEVALPKSQWAKALEGCLKDFEAFDEGDLAIDCYMLKKKLIEED